MHQHINPRIEISPSRRLIGMSLETSLIKNKTVQLFKTFMPRKKEIQNVVSKNVFDIRVYPSDYYAHFNPSKNFTKWAAVEVTTFEAIPDGMKSIIVESGQYAVFTIYFRNASTAKNARCRRRNLDTCSIKSLVIYLNTTQFLRLSLI